MPWGPIIDSQILAIHAGLVPTREGGDVLYFGGDQHWEQNNIGHEADPSKVDASRRFGCRPGPDGSHAITYVKSPTTDVFCSGHAFLGDGRLLVAGGTQLFPAGAVGGPHGHGELNHAPGHRNCWTYHPSTHVFTEVAAMNPQFEGRHLSRAAQVTALFQQTPGVFAALTVDQHGAMNVAWLDTHLQPMRWSGPVAFGDRHLSPGGAISPIFEQSPGIFAALTVDQHGAMNVVWLDTNVEQVRWQGPVGFGDQHLVPGAPVTPVFEQSPGIFAALTVDRNGVMNVVWLDTHQEPIHWRGPVGFGGQHLAPGAPVTPVFEQSPGIFAALTVDRNGVMNVVWLDTHQEPIHWRGPVGFGGQHLAPGAPVTPVFEQSPGIFAALTVDRNGAMNVVWLDTHQEPIHWRGPVGFGGQHLAPGAPVTPVFEQSPGIFAALTVDRNGAMNVVWLDTHQEPIHWRGPVGFGSQHLAPGAYVTPVFAQSPGVFAALTVDRYGAMNVVWLDTHQEPIHWRGPVGFGGQHLAPGAPVTPVFAQTAGVFAALTVDDHAMNVVWLDTHQQPMKWRGPVAFGALGGGRWYPTVVTLATGELFVYAGHPRNDDSRHNPGTPERYDPVADRWTLLPPTIGAGAGFPDLYPRLFLLPDGRVFCASALSGFPKCARFDAYSNAIDQPVGLPGMHYRLFNGSAVLLPLLPNDGYRPRVLVCGGETAERVNLQPSDGTPPQWQKAGDRHGSAAGKERFHTCAVILPTGQMLMTGGVLNPETHNPDVGVNEPEIYAPAIDWGAHTDIAAGVYRDVADPNDRSDRWDTIEEPSPVVRNYHSTALLLPDGRVWTAGSSIDGQQGDPTIQGERKITIFSPPYPSGARPRITKAPRAVGYAQPFTVETPEAASIHRIALLRCGSVTHAFDSDQRYVGLTFTRADENRLVVQGPPSAEIAPPGQYMLFLIDRAGRPCQYAAFVRIGKVGWQGPAAFGDQRLTPGGWVTPVLEQTPDVFAALSIDRNGAMNVVWLDLHHRPVGWNGPVGFGGQHLVPGAPVSPIFEQTPGIFAALTVDRDGRMNVVWLDTHQHPVQWRGPVAFGGQHLVPGAPVSPIFEQTPGIFAALTVDRDGAMNVVWLDTHQQPMNWKGPVPFGGRHLAPGAWVSPLFEQSPGIFAALTVDRNSVMNVVWLDTHQLPMQWRGPVAFGGHHLVPGAPISPVFEQSPGIFAALTVDRFGATNVVWLDLHRQPVGWQGPVGFGGQHLAPGAPISPVFEQSPSIFAALAVDRFGVTNVVWLDLHQQPVGWKGPTGFGPPDLRPGAHMSPVFEQSPGIFACLTIGRQGALHVVWLDTHQHPIQWRGPVAFGGQHLVLGAPITPLFRQGADVFAALTVDRHGAMNVVWLDLD